MGQGKKYVIVGNGIAGLSAAETIRKHDGEGDITLIAAEDYLTYYRLKLSYNISNKDFKAEDLLLHDEKWYQDRKIQVLLGCKAEGIQVEKQILVLEDGREIPYDQLLLANGSRPFVPPIKGNEKEGVFVLRTIEDLKRLQAYFENCKSITVLGGGLLGLEAAWAINKLNKEINVIEFFNYLLPRQLDEDLSKKFSAQLEENGLNIYLGVATDEILGDGRVEGIRLSDGREVKTDAVLISAGIRPILDLVKDTGIEFDKGVKVNQQMKTNIDNIYAAGDVAEFKGMVVGLWSISSEQGKVAGENMAGGNKAYELPELNAMLTLDQLTVFSAGNIKDFDGVVEEVDEGKNAHYKLYIANGKVIGGVVMNDMSKVPKVKKLVSNNMDLTEKLEKNMGFKEILESI